MVNFCGSKGNITNIFFISKRDAEKNEKYESDSICSLT